MAEEITARQFHEADRVEDWRLLIGGVFTRFHTDSLAASAALVNAISVAAEGHIPDIDLRPGSVTVRLAKPLGEPLTTRHVTLAQRISAAARELGVSADPSAVQVVQLGIDALVGSEVLPFWRAVLGYRDSVPSAVIDPHGRGPVVWFQQMDAPRPQRNRIHVDVSVPHDQAEARVAAAIAAGGRLISDQYAPAFWTLADAEGNEVDVATWLGRD
jgi:4a-hydroxytetrahydrobiopterin dehydratase